MRIAPSAKTIVTPKNNQNHSSNTTASSSSRRRIMAKLFLNSIAICGIIQILNLWLSTSPSLQNFFTPSDSQLFGFAPILEETITIEDGANVLKDFRWNSSASLLSLQQSQQAIKKNIHSDGTFNGFDIKFINHRPISKIHCVGENFDENRSWLYRSCEYTTFCLDLERGEFVVYPEETPVSLPQFWWSSTQMNDKNQTSVAGGSQPKSWFPVIAQEQKQMKTHIGRYQPRIRYKKKHIPTSYYYMNATFLPFYRHPASYRNPGHLLWDDFLPLYTLLDMFDRTDEEHLALAHMLRPTTKEFEEPIPPFDIFSKFLPLMIGSDNAEKQEVELSKIGSQKLKLKNPSSEHSTNIVCAKAGLTGGGLFSDHGEHRWHGQWPSDRKLPHNLGRGGLLRRYRSFLMQHIGVDPQEAPKPGRVVISQSSSSKSWRANLTFSDYIEELDNQNGNGDIEVIPLEMSSMSLKEQIEITSTASVYLTAVGGGSATAMFLPKGAHLILFYNPNQYLDWDFWNNFPHLNVHWIGMWRENRTGPMIHTYPKRFVELVKRLLNDMKK